jgi:hypothetical protein
MDYYDTDEETVFTNDSDQEDLNIDEIYNTDYEYTEIQKQNYEYCIGICKVLPNDSQILLLNSISSSIFLKFPFEHVLKYLQNYSIIYVHEPVVDIMQIVISQQYRETVLKKTYWIKLIQRHWRNVIKKRYEIYNRRYNPASLKHRETTGRFPHHLKSLPGLHGMLRMYRKNNLHFVKR